MGPEWKAKKDLAYNMELACKARVANLILATLKLRPLTKSLGEVGFLHTDLWSNNLLKKGNAIIAIDFETATTGPAFVDLSSPFFTFSVDKLKYIDKETRERLLGAFANEVGKKEKMEDMLFDLEIGFLHRMLWIILFVHMYSKTPKQNERLVTIGELMLKALEQGLDNCQTQKKILKEGVYFFAPKDFPPPVESEDVQ